MKFKKYINLYCKIHFLNETELNSYYDIKFDFFLISSKIVRIYYSLTEIFEMKNKQKIRCEEIESKKKSKLWTKIFIRNMIIEKNFVTMKKKFHIMSELLCSIILNTNFMKFFDIIFKWKKKEKCDLMIIQKNHQIEVQITKTKFFLIKKIDFFKSKFKSKKRQMNIYAKKSAILNHNQKKNVKIKHKFLIFENYVFELIRKIDLNFFSCLFEIHVVVSNDCDVVSMINFEKTFAKIYSKQFFKQFRHFKTFKSSVINIIFNYENVFFEKSIETNEMINFFELKNSKKNQFWHSTSINIETKNIMWKLFNVWKNTSRYSDSN